MLYCLDVDGLTSDFTILVPEYSDEYRVGDKCEDCSREKLQKQISSVVNTQATVCKILREESS